MNTPTTPACPLSADAIVDIWNGLVEDYGPLSYVVVEFARRVLAAANSSVTPNSSTTA